MNKLRIVLYCLITIFSFSCNDPAVSPYQSVTFEKKSILPGSGRASAVTFVIDGKGYVALGRAGTRTAALNDCWQYDPIFDSWNERANFPGTARVKAIAAVVNGNAYVGLGYDPDKRVYTNGNLHDLWMYNPTIDNWTLKDSFPGAGTDACVSFVFNNCIYIGAGFTESSFSNEFWKYNPELDIWTKLKDFPGEDRMGAVLCADSDRVYFGTGYHLGNNNDWWEYFPLTDSWKKRKSMPDNGRENAVSLCIGNRFFVSTGRHFGSYQTGGKVLSDIVEFDADKNHWYERGNIPGGARENAVAFTINGVGYIGLGEDDTHMLNDLWSFEP